MNFDDLEQLWRSPHNHPTPIDMQKQKAQFVTNLRREYRGFILRMTLILTGLSVLTVKVIHHIATQDALQLPREKAIDLASEWALIPFILLPWVAAIHFVRLHFKHRRSHPNYDESIATSLGAMIDATQLAIKRLRIMAALFLAGIPICALCIQQIYDAGKIRPQELTSMITFFSIIAVVALGCFAIEYFRNLKPRKRELESLLQSYAG